MHKIGLSWVLSLSLAIPGVFGQIPDQLYSNMSWRNIGPERGGRCLGVAGSPGRPNEYYFGATGGGLWKTTDGGNEWAPATDGQLTSSSVGAPVQRFASSMVR